MTNPGDSDEWWKQYGGEGVSSDSGGHQSVPPTPPQQPTPPPNPQAGYSSAPHQQSSPYQQPTPPPQQQQSYPSYPQQQPYGQPGYGYPAATPYQPYGYAAPQQGTNGLAIGSLIASILGLCTCIGSIVGIILGVIALNQIKERGGQGRGMALGGIWVGAVGIVLTIVWVIVNIAAANW
ncbi:DUF4190 domain-containing protein [Nocardia aobensis]|jgi:hypothetical protein|uniref:DUF4190 domain-containing protein n=4 Tax=Nocardia TaxID=1817 RepID=A0A378WKR7_9NOCA|nr:MULTISPECIES: DUF4190 domain-containing protein [Nocardia]MBF6242900.1 DUF4190 domain-containing protein [Nocardia elegans]MCC3316459.1 DUF4190 domain-containing protein [Nocardia africana]PSR58754.1 DUF4190 domain-containing protein [Nocardia sp. MDA0666]PSR65912.1 DUF4190 domain-containing protein [Nocardia nova]SUA41185.1 Uncharacterised protein [Nocardia africana]